MTKAAELAKMGEVLTNSQIGGRRNIIINGAMQVSQRGTSFTGVGDGDNAYFLDRFQFLESGTPNGVFTITQASDGPAGFANSMKVDCTTAETAVAANERIFIQQKIEGQNLQHLKKGTSSAESLTLSFWVKTNKTGTYTLELLDNDNSRSFSQTYTVSSANTWEKKTITYAGDTTGAFDNDNGNSFQCNFWLGAGSNFTSGTFQNSWGSKIAANRVSSSQVNLADSTSNEWYITGVQLEAGSVASDFEFLPVDVNLARCQRYYYLHVSGSQDVGVGGYYLSSHIFFNITFPNTMRAVPTVDYVSGTDYYKISRNGATDNFNDIAGGGVASLNEISLYNNSQVSGTAGDAGYVRSNNASASIALNSELS